MFGLYRNDWTLKSNFQSVYLGNKNKFIIAYAGAYVPLTKEGKIMVDDVLASCYAAVDHELAHIGMMPIRWFPEIVQWVFGEDDGYSAFAKTTKELCESGLPNELFW